MTHDDIGVLSRGTNGTTSTALVQRQDCHLDGILIAHEEGDGSIVRSIGGVIEERGAGDRANRERHRIDHVRVDVLRSRSARSNLQSRCYNLLASF